jgi:hypothetical protein
MWIKNVFRKVKVVIVLPPILFLEALQFYYLFLDFKKTDASTIAIIKK